MPTDNDTREKGYRLCLRDHGAIIGWWNGWTAEWVEDRTAGTAYDTERKAVTLQTHLQARVRPDQRVGVIYDAGTGTI